MGDFLEVYNNIYSPSCAILVIIRPTTHKAEVFLRKDSGLDGVNVPFVVCHLTGTPYKGSFPPKKMVVGRSTFVVWNPFCATDVCCLVFCLAVVFLFINAIAAVD